ncbi:MAG: hypothetical protein ACHQHO_13815 [Solirubrobacterales bacterium]
MKQLKMIYVALSVIAFAASLTAATASAEVGEVTPGLLFLKGVTFPITATLAGGEAILTAGVNSIACTEAKAEASFSNEGEAVPPHVRLGSNGTIDITGCTTQGGTVSCRSEAEGKKDPKGTVLAAGNLDAVALLSSSKELRPGVLIIVSTPAIVNCGGLRIEVRGALAAEGELTEATEDVTLGVARLPTALSCDTSDATCKAILAEKPFQANFSGTFESASITAEAHLHVSEMVRIDY